MGSSMLSAPNLSIAGGHLAAQELRTVGLLLLFKREF